MTASEEVESSEDRRRKVRFHGRVQFKTIRHVADFSEDEISDGWYRKNDFIRMSDEVAEIAKLLADGKEFHQGEELCIRGLEHLVEEDVADYRAEKMIASIDAVLDEQDEQADEDIYDPDLIAEIYGEIVSPLLREAYLVGLRDAKEGAAAAALIPDLEVVQPSLMVEEERQPEKVMTESVAPEPEKQTEEKEQPADDLPEEENKEEYADLAPMSSHADHEEGLLNLNTSLSSIGTEVHIEKKPPPPTKKGSPEKTHKTRDKQSTFGSKSESTQKSPTRKNLRRKTFNRKGGTELSPFVFRRDGTIKFRNFDVEHRKREQSKLRKEAIKSSMFKFLENDDGADDISHILSKSAPTKKNKKPGLSLTRTSKGSTHQRKS
ncbi:hypothetical protein IV203_006095 [Nitzschia inconspicua]|uniref:Uncharacterized protein n=1 Tax=Nitzschia inconspicua TaxID=303405 RepID=A0A9K3KPB2_9STRA|nr:hypothetical protein IV203_006095 [Nitzschia inconspicua]